MLSTDHLGTTMARLARPRTDTPTRLAVVADPHVATRTEGTSKLFEHTLDHFERAISNANARGVDAILSPGDLTKDGEPWNYDAVDDVLADSHPPFYAVPGNHDVPKTRDDHDTIPVSEFADRYATGDFPFHAIVGNLDILGVNSSGTRNRLYESHDGEVDVSQREWLTERLTTAENPIVLIHHNFPPVTDQLDRHRDEVEPEMARPPVMRNPADFTDVLADGDVPLVLAGHYHLPATGVVDGVREITVPTTCSFPQSYLILDIDETGTSVRLIPIADEIGLEYGHAARSGDSTTARGLTAIAAARLASFPLVDETTDDA